MYCLSKGSEASEIKEFVESLPEEESSPENLLKLNDDSLDDLSKWLKPKKGNISPCSIEQQCNAAYTHNPLKNRFVDFPCLRTDPGTWVPAKRAKKQAASCSTGAMLPPEYSLPAPFWLKKHC